MTNSIRFLIILLISLAGLLYAFVIVYAIVLTLGKPHGSLDPVLTNAVTVIGGVLSTNLGAVLGVTFTPRALRTSQIPGRFLGLRPSLQNAADEDPSQPGAGQRIQIIACWVYVGGLLIALIGWIIAKIQHVPEAQIQVLLPEMVNTLLGVIVGALTVALGRNQQGN